MGAFYDIIEKDGTDNKNRLYFMEQSMDEWLQLKTSAEITTSIPWIMFDWCLCRLAAVTPVE